MDYINDLWQAGNLLIAAEMEIDNREARRMRLVTAVRSYARKSGEV